MQIEYLKISSIKPYEKNTRKHTDKDVGEIVKSIKKFGFNDPIGIWSNENIIVEGHGRYQAAQKLGLKEIPCIRLDNLTDEQRRAYAIAHNATNELSEFDFNNLADELSYIDLNDFNFDFELPNIDEEVTYKSLIEEFQNRMSENELSEDDEEYQQFVEKFKPKKTTDDCYTPPIVYEAVADYVAEYYDLNKNNFVRPFAPNGDYQDEKYKKMDIVVDNPPFSIMTEILDFYNAHDIKYFLFAPHLTLFSTKERGACICVGVGIIYENGANVNTSFITNLEDCAFRTAPKLYNAIKNANFENLKQTKKSMPKYKYPLNVVTSAMLSPYSQYGIEFKVNKDECQYIRQLDNQKESGKTLFGGGFLISDSKKDLRIVAEKEINEIEKTWELSQKEIDIIKSLK